ncbi:toll-like receptor 7 [Anopheles aquasalis]|uniref:toll-like receptor 7 n=1 Tax=Anopheles aquasalis TaxID=42839 RepID=UPI00215A63C0|nr:toll-like receptor 7 [Anopheles aquasalis]
MDQVSFVFLVSLAAVLMLPLPPAFAARIPIFCAPDTSCTVENVTATENDSFQLIGSILQAYSVAFVNCRLYSLPQIPRAGRVSANNSDLVRLYPSTFVNVENLDVSYNRLEEFSPNVTERPEELRQLALQGNVALTNFTFLRSLTRLNTLNMAEMNLEGFDFDLLSSMSRLSNLNMSHSNINELPANISKPKGNVIDLSRNAITRVVSHTFDCYRDYIYGNECKIDLSNNKITIIEKKAFKGTSKINLQNNNIITIESNAFKENTEVNLQNNNISIIVKDAFKKVYYVNLQNNNISTIKKDAFNEVSNVNLKNNNISDGIHPNAFKGVTELILSNNDLSNFEFLQQLKSLRTLNLSYVPYFSRCTDSCNVFGTLRNLEILDLSNNEITELPVGIFSGLVSLKALNLRHNSISHIEYGTFITPNAGKNWRSRERCRIPEVDLSYNRINALDFSLFRSGCVIERLLLHGNGIQWVPDDLLQFGLSTIGLQNTQVTCANLIKLLLKDIYVVNDHDDIPVFNKPNVYGIGCVNREIR